MEGSFPTLDCLLQSTLRSLCTSSDASSTSKWVYAVFWRILPRNYPPPKWDYGGTSLDRSKGNKRNWILVWEDGFCDFYECERVRRSYMKGRFGPQVFFKMSHEVYNFGEGLVGRVAADNSHKWVFRPIHSENDPCFISSWNVSIEPQPKAWDFQFSSGIQTIAIISVREGIIQLGSLHKISEDLNLVINVQRKFSHLQSIPGIFTTQRPYFPFQNPSLLKPNIQFTVESKESALATDEKNQKTGFKRSFDERLDDCPTKSINLGWNSAQNGIPGPPIWSIPPLVPSMSCNLGAFLSKLPSGIHYFSNPDRDLVNSNQSNCPSQQIKASGCSAQGQREPEDSKIETSWQVHCTTSGKPSLASPSFDLKDEFGKGSLNAN